MNHKGVNKADGDTADDRPHYLVVGITEADLMQHIAAQDRSPYTSRLWICGPGGPVQVVAVGNIASLDKVRMSYEGVDVPSAEVLETDLPLLVRSADEVNNGHSSGADEANVDHQLRELDQQIIAARIAETMRRLMSAHSAADACALLDIRDTLVAHDIDLALKHEVDLDEMQWSVTAEEMMWADAAGVHYDGNAIFFFDRWEFFPLSELWLRHCAVTDFEDLTADMIAGCDIWMSVLARFEKAYQQNSDAHA